MQDVAARVREAESRIRPYIRETILAKSVPLSRAGNAEVYCKYENLQHTGSFKARGAMNRLLVLTPEERARGVVAASTGNHGAAVARSACELGAPCIVFVTENASSAKLQTIEQYQAEIRPFGTDCAQTEARAREYSARKQMTYISPYNDLDVISGQGTVGVEIVRQLDHKADAVLVSLGGGLISGVAAHLKSVWPSVRVIGCSPENSQVMIQSVKAGKVLDIPSLPTLSDGTAGGVEQGAITFKLCQSLVDEYVTVTEGEIRESLRTFIETHSMLIEGAAAVAVAAYRKLSAELTGKTTVILICGGNISLDTLRSAL
ncbi:threonine/serine dehydratase [Candidatus Eisenbacteria bacterium]|uniref:Threonine/serine dehydratase n=1 Tax=Eiseniibacteriota bacterium TaxID=2212470 RepID=A0ABV6YIL7_UNCEI